MHLAWFKESFTICYSFITNWGACCLETQEWGGWEI